MTVMLVVESKTIGPLNTAAVVNSMITLNCVKNDSSSVRWVVRPHDQRAVKVISNGQHVNKEFIQRFSVDAVNGGPKLTIQTVQETDAGVYECWDLYEDSFQSAALIVAADPTCNTNLSSSTHSIDESEYFTITCSVRYSGPWPPSFSCQPYVNEQDVKNDTTIHYVTYNHSLQATRHMHGATLSCTMYFDNASAPTTVNASNQPSYSKTLTLPILNVAHGPTQPVIHSTNGTVVKHGDTVNCSSEGQPQPDIEWRVLTTGDVVHSGRHYTVNMCELKQRFEANRTLTLHCVAIRENRKVASTICIKLDVENTTAFCTDGLDVYNLLFYLLVGCGTILFLMLVVSIIVRLWFGGLSCSNHNLRDHGEPGFKPAIQAVIIDAGPLMDEVHADQREPDRIPIVPDRFRGSLEKLMPSDDRPGVSFIGDRQQHQDTVSDMREIQYAELAAVARPPNAAPRTAPTARRDSPPPVYASIDHIVCQTHAKLNLYGSPVHR